MAEKADKKEQASSVESGGIAQNFSVEIVDFDGKMFVYRNLDKTLAKKLFDTVVSVLGMEDNETVESVYLIVGKTILDAMKRDDFDFDE